jgi:hypothetical protein
MGYLQVPATSDGSLMSYRLGVPDSGSYTTNYYLQVGHTGLSYYYAFCVLFNLSGIPEGAALRGAQVRFGSTSSNLVAEPCTTRIWGQMSAEPVTPYDRAGFWALTERTDSYVDWEIPPVTKYYPGYTDDLVPIFQELLDAYPGNYDEGGAVQLLFFGEDCPSDRWRSFFNTEYVTLWGTYVPWLFLEWDDPSSHVYVGSGADDYEVSGIGGDEAVSDSSVWVTAGDAPSGQVTSGFIFRGVDIPENSTITRAWVDLTCAEWASYETVRLSIYGVIGSSPPVTSEEYHALSLTSTCVGWDPVPIVYSYYPMPTPDLTPVLQELYDIGGSLDDVHLLLVDAGSSGDSSACRAFYSHEYDHPTMVAWLHVLYEAVEPPEPELPPTTIDDDPLTPQPQAIIRGVVERAETISGLPVNSGHRVVTVRYNHLTQEKMFWLWNKWKNSHSTVTLRYPDDEGHGYSSYTTSMSQPRYSSRQGPHYLGVEIDFKHLIRL